VTPLARSASALLFVNKRTAKGLVPSAARQLRLD
jgi:hypothetical protein